MTIDATLADQEARHGSFPDQCETASALKALLHASKRWRTMTPVQREALDMIAVKLARICNGNPDDVDHWHDLQGYARLVEIAIQPEPDVLPAIVKMR